VISFQNVSARRAPLTLASVSLEWGPGIHSIVGGREDGGTLLLALAAGIALPRSGRVRILDRSPEAVRKEIARIPLEPSLPDTMRVDEMLRVASHLRSEAVRSPTERLAIFGIESLAGRTVRSLSRGEVRAVSLAEALTSSRVRVVLIEEPGTWMDPRAAGRVAEGLRAKAQADCAIVLTTASTEDARDLASDHVVMQRGTVVSGPASTNPRLSDLRRAHLVLVSASEGDARLLAAGLARDSVVAGLAQEGAVVRVRSPDPVGLARAVANTAVDASAEIVEMRWEADSAGDPRSAWAESPRARQLARPRDGVRSIASSSPEPAR
jgi:ABC-type multidrug transport system ATPase subunit